MTITENAWSLLITTPAPPLAPLSSRLIRWRSTRICFSSSLSSPTVMLSERFIGEVAATASRQIRRISSRCAGLAQPGKAVPERFRARRIRVISTIAVLLLAASVNSDGLSMSDAMVMGSTRGLRVGRDGLFDLADFIAGTGSIFITLGFNRLCQVEFEFRETVVNGFSL